MASILSVVFFYSEAASFEAEITTQSISSGTTTSPDLINSASQNLVHYVSPSKENSHLADQSSRKIDKTFELPLKTKNFSKIASMIALGLMCLGVVAVIHFIRRRSNSISR
jgi:hypothetical protein